MRLNFFHVLAVALILSAGSAHPQATEWVTIDLGTVGLPAGNTGIGDDGTFAWVEINAGMIEVYRKRPDGSVELVTSHVGGMEDVGWPGPLPVQNNGAVVSRLKKSANNRWDKYADDVLAHTDSRSSRVATSGTSLVFDASWSGNGFGHLSEFDISTSTRTVHTIQDRFLNVRPLAVSSSDALFLQGEGVDPADSGFYFWKDGVLTSEPAAGLPDGFTIDYSDSGADISDDKLGYFYRGIPDDFSVFPEEIIVIVVKDLVTAEVSSFWFGIALPYQFGGRVEVDGTGRAYYELDLQPTLDVIVHENGTSRVVEAVFCGIWDVNSSGHLAYVRNTAYDCTDEAGPTDTTDIFIRDMADNTETQVTFNEPHTYIFGLRISESDDIAFSYSAGVAFPDLTYPSLYAAASVIDTDPPSTPSDLTATVVSQTRIDLAWKPSTDGVALQGYDVFRDNALLATVSAPGYQDAGLMAGTTHTYYVEAFDLANNRSQSSSVTATTLPRIIVDPAGGSGAISTMLVGLLAGLILLRRPGARHNEVGPR